MSSPVHQWNPALSPVFGTLLTFRTCAGYTESSLMIPKALIQKHTVADIDFYHHSLSFFFQDRETEPERRSNFPKAAEKVGSSIKVRTKENLMSRNPGYHIHSQTLSLKWSGSYGLWGKRVHDWRQVQSPQPLLYTHSSQRGSLRGLFQS